MNNNDYAFTPTFELNVTEIRKIVFSRLMQHRPPPELASHQRWVSREPYLVELQQQYPFLSDIYNIFRTDALHPVPAHQDASRSCALNIPVQYTEDSHTIFYRALTPQQHFIEERVYNLITGPCEELWRFTMTEPTVINTAVPHAVITGPHRERIIMSWSVREGYTYEDLRNRYTHTRRSLDPHIPATNSDQFRVN